MPRDCTGDGGGRTARVTAAVLGIVLAQAAPALAECGHDGVQITAPVERHDAICGALDDVLGYFRGIGFAFDPQVSIEMAETVTITLVDADGASVERTVMGVFEPSLGTIRVTDPGADPTRMRAPWGIAWNEDLALSVLRHELTHMAVHAVLGPEACKLGCAWHEFIAYAVQFDLMPPGLRDEVERSHPGPEGFERLTEVNPFSLFIDPDQFAVKAWRSATSLGGGPFIARLLRGESGIPTGEILWTK